MLPNHFAATGLGSHSIFEALDSLELVIILSAIPYYCYPEVVGFGTGSRASSIVCRPPT